MKQKTILLELLRWLCAGLAVVFLVVSFRQEPVSSAAFEDVASAVTASIDLSALQEGSVQMVKRLYGLNPSDFDGCLLYYPQTNMEAEELLLLKLRDMKLGVFEVPIETIYIDDNSGSHFNPVRDAIRIYAVIFKYLFSSVTSFAVDYLLYWLCLGFKIAPLLSYALARVVSSQVNYHLNKHTVFSGRGGKYSMVKYYALVVIQGLIGAGLVQFLPTVLPVSAAVIKIPVDLVLFGLSYFIQRDFVFDK